MLARVVVDDDDEEEEGGGDCCRLLLACCNNTVVFVIPGLIEFDVIKFFPFPWVLLPQPNYFYI
ncbi:hypothetical protein BLOT_008032 [Blomia tropicalis]|nr:hypothetical protein BLOT_008032 [Blomia tropicalis]